MPDTTDIKVDIESLKKDIENMNTINGRIDTAIDKLTDVSTSIKSMLAVHEEKIARQEKIDEVIFDKLKDRADEISDVYRELKKDVMQCWIMFVSDETEENKFFGVAIGRIAELPNFNQYEIVICTGKRREFWENQLVKEITEFAKHNKCKRSTAAIN